MKHLRTYIFVGAVLAVVPIVAFAAMQQGTTCNSLVGFCNPLASSTICGALKSFLTATMQLLSPVLVVLFVLAGARFVFARGNAEKLIVARRNLLYVIVGSAIFLGAWLIGQIAANTIAALTNGTGNSGSIMGSCN
jgi:hypothetical protein